MRIGTESLARIVAVILLGVFLAGCTLSRSPVSGKKRAYAYSWAQERQLGQEADQQIVSSFGLYEHENLQDYVDRIGQRVLAVSDMREPGTPQEFQETPFVFRVLDSPVVNAFALPGGYIYVTRGLLAHLNSEAQLAVVLGHEIGHVAARHASQRALEQQLGQIALLGGAVAGQAILNVPAQDLLNLGGTAAQLMFLKYGRDDERESDNLGVEYAARAGYDAAEGAAFFESLERIGEQQGGAIPTWMSSHPDPGEREETIRQLSSEWRQRLNEPMNVVDREQLYSHLAGIVLGENPRQGFAEDGTFYHPDLRFRFPIPRGFQVVNQPTQVVMIDQQQRAAEIFTISQASSLREAAQQFVGQQGVQVVNSGPTSSNGMNAYYVLADVATGEGQVFRLLNYWVEYEGRIYHFLGYAQRNDYSAYEREFERSMQGFARLTDASILNIEAARLDVTEAARRAPFSEYVQSDLPFGLSPTGIAIMNQVGMDEVIESGRLLKLVDR